MAAIEVADASGRLPVVSRPLPSSWLDKGMREVLVRDEGASAILIPTAILAGFAFVVTGLAARLFSWETA